FEFFFVQNSKPLFFVDHHEPEIFKNDIARDESMRANDGIYTPFAQNLEDFFLLSLRTEAAKHLDSHGVIKHTLPKHFEMLLGQTGRGREDGNLFAVHDRFKTSANGHFGLAEPDIPA